MQAPIAVFAYGDKEKAQNVIVEIQHEDRNFVVGIHFNQDRHGAIVNDIRGLYPKDNAEWLNWISQGKALRVDKEKIQTLIDQQRRTLAEVEYLDLEDVAKVVKDFVNPPIPARKKSNTAENGSSDGRLSLREDGADYDAGVRYSVSGDGTVDEYNRAVNTQGKKLNLGGREVRPRMTRFNFQEAFQDAMLSLYCLPHLQTADFFKAKNQICSILFCVIGRKVLILRH